MKKKKLLKRKPKAANKPLLKKTLKSVDDIQLPLQADEDIQLVDTEQSLLLDLAKPNEFRTAIKDAKMEFVSKVKKYAQICNIEATQVRVYFTFKNIHAKE